MQEHRLPRIVAVPGHADHRERICLAQQARKHDAPTLRGGRISVFHITDRRQRVALEQPRRLLADRVVAVLGDDVVRRELGRKRRASLAKDFVEHAERAASAVNLALDESNVDQNPLMRNMSPFVLDSRKALGHLLVEDGLRADRSPPENGRAKGRKEDPGAGCRRNCSRSAPGAEHAP